MGLISLPSLLLRTAQGNFRYSHERPNEIPHLRFRQNHGFVANSSAGIYLLKALFELHKTLLQLLERLQVLDIDFFPLCHGDLSLYPGLSGMIASILKTPLPRCFQSRSKAWRWKRSRQLPDTKIPKESPFFLSSSTPRRTR